MVRCREWIKVDTELKLDEVAGFLTEHVGNECQCNTSVNQSHFLCSEQNHNDITFRASIISNFDAEANKITEFVQAWINSQVQVTIHEEVFSIKEDGCPIEISSFDDPLCIGTMSSSLSNHIVIGITSAAAATVVAALICLLVCLCFMALNALKR